MRAIPGALVRSALLLVLGLSLSPAARATLMNFDAPADGTVVDSYYFQPFLTSVTFTNPLGPGSIYARTFGYNHSPGNVVSPLQTGAPTFNELQGWVEADVNVVLGNSINIVSVWAAAAATIEPIGTPQNRPYMQVYDQFDTLLGTVYFQGALPTNPLETTAFERLSFKMPPCTGGPMACDTYGIGKVRLSAQLGQGGPLMYALFDDLEINPPTCAPPVVVNGDGSSCTQTLYGDSCTTWTCDPGTQPLASDPVCVGGSWTGDLTCDAIAPPVPVMPGPGYWLLVALIACPGVVVLALRRA